MNTTKKRTSKRANPLAIVIMAILIIVAVVGIIVLLTGYRYINDNGVKFSGFVKDGQPVSGTVKYKDGISGKLTKEKDSPLGTITYSTGDVYEGEISGILRHGKGKITYSETGEVYSGDFLNDELTGYAECTSPDGSSYVGELVNGQKHGKGKHIYPDGSYYYGDFVNNKRHGVGEQHYADSSYYYGSFVDDKKHGNTEVNVTLENGMVYTGKCKMVYANGDVYVGDFLNDFRTGYGKYTWSTGESYEGEFLSDMMHGHGSYDFANGKPVYTGEFSNGQLAESAQDNSDVTE